MEQEHQEYHNHKQSGSISKEIVDKIEINPPKDGRNLLAAHQSQAKWEELYPLTFYSASSQGWLRNLANSTVKECTGRLKQ